MPDDAPAESSRRSSSGTWWIFWPCFILFILYPLSTGPVVLLLEKGIISDDRFLVIYKPLELVYENSDTAQRFFDWYTELWGLP